MMVVAEGGRGVVAVVRKKSYMRQIMNCEEEKIRDLTSSIMRDPNLR